MSCMTMIGIIIQTFFFVFNQMGIDEDYTYQFSIRIYRCEKESGPFAIGKTRNGWIPI